MEATIALRITLDFMGSPKSRQRDLGIVPGTQLSGKSIAVAKPKLLDFQRFIDFSTAPKNVISAFDE
jgi:hypothetical protein